MSDFNIQQFAVDNLICNYCGVFPGEWCITVNGNRAEVHVGRWEPIARAWGDGYAEAEWDLLDMVTTNPEAFERAVVRHRSKEAGR